MTAFYRLLPGSTAGLRVWLTYGVVEYVAWVARPLLGWQVGVLPSSHWAATLVFLVCYAAAGLAFGAVAGWALFRVYGDSACSEERHQVAAVATLSLACLVNTLVPLKIDAAAGLLIATALMLIVALSAGLVWPGWSERLALLTNPWVASLMLVGGPWLGAPTPRRRVMFTVAVAAAALAAGVWPLLRRWNYSWSAPGRAWALLGAVAILTAFGTVASSRRLPDLPVRPPGVNTPNALPNVILIVLDTVRADRLSLYGYERDTTPELKRWASQATVFTRAIATSNYTLPSHASLFTGLYMGRHGAHTHNSARAGRPLPSQWRTLAEWLSQLGYRSVATVANYAYLHQGFGFAQGFHLYDCPAIPVPLMPLDSHRLRYRVGELLASSPVSTILNFEARRAADINRDAFSLLDRVRLAGGPFFLFLNYMDAHQIAPVHIHSPYPMRGPRPSFADRMEIIGGQRPLKPGEREFLQDSYDNAISYLDSQIGGLLRRLRELDLHDNSIIVITSDHGEALGEKNLFGHDLDLAQNQIHVPLIVKYPGQTRGTVESILASGADVMPTILDVLGQAPDPGFDGRSLRTPSSLAQRVVLSEAYRRTTSPRRLSLSPKYQWALFSGTRKLIESDSAPPQLYDLSKDPTESNNLFRPDDPVTRDLQSRLRFWRKLVAGSSDPAGSTITPEMLERLKTLGYVQ